MEYCDRLLKVSECCEHCYAERMSLGFQPWGLRAFRWSMLPSTSGWEITSIELQMLRWKARYLRRTEIHTPNRKCKYVSPKQRVVYRLEVLKHNAASLGRVSS